MKLIFASNNKNKIAEIQNLLAGVYDVLPMEAIGCTVDIPETADTIEGNALLKAQYIWENYQIPCFADDSGLEVEHLNGAPGVHSARYGGLPKSDKKNTQKLLAALEGQENRNANFKTVIALIIGGETHLFEGKVFGKITEKPSGNQGFGYDPIFIPNGYTKTFAEFQMAEKSKISHRGLAVQQLVTFLKR